MGIEVVDLLRFVNMETPEDPRRQATDLAVSIDKGVATVTVCARLYARIDGRWYQVPVTEVSVEDGEDESEGNLLYKGKLVITVAGLLDCFALVDGFCLNKKPVTPSMWCTVGDTLNATYSRHYTANAR